MTFDPARVAAYVGKYRSEDEDVLVFGLKADTFFRVKGADAGVSFHRRD